MIKTKEMFPDGYYVLTGASTARDLFFDDDQDIVEFKELFERMLCGYLQVYRMLLYKDQWFIAIKLNNKEQIKKQYLYDRDRSKKANRANDYHEPWRMISERVRVFLCNFVANTNKRKNRKGGKVSSSYKRYYFTNLSEMENEMKNWEERKIASSQKSNTYKYLERHYKVNEKDSGKRMLVFCKMEDVVEFCTIHTHEIWTSMMISIDVVGTWISSTITLHNRPG